MNNYTPAQQNAINTWTSERDELLRQISIHKTSLEGMKKDLTEGGLALSDLQKQTANAEGRLSVLSEAEEIRKNSVSIELSELEIRKSKLESEIVEKNNELKVIETRKHELISDIGILGMVGDTLKDNSDTILKTVGTVVEKSDQFMVKAESSLSLIKELSNEVITKSEKNVEQTNIVLEKLPKYIFELQRPIPVRRAFSAPRGTVIEPDKESS